MLGSHIPRPQRGFCLRTTKQCSLGLCYGQLMLQVFHCGPCCGRHVAIDWCCECFQRELRSTDVVRFLHNHVAAMSLGFLSRVMLQSINVTSVLVGAMLQPAGVVKFLFGHVTASDVARFLLASGCGRLTLRVSVWRPCCGRYMLKVSASGTFFRLGGVSLL